jgi:hypothetical protein
MVVRKSQVDSAIISCMALCKEHGLNFSVDFPEPGDAQVTHYRVSYGNKSVNFSSRDVGHIEWHFGERKGTGELWRTYGAEGRIKSAIEGFIINNGIHSNV